MLNLPKVLLAPAQDTAYHPVGHPQEFHFYVQRVHTYLKSSYPSYTHHLKQFYEPNSNLALGIKMVTHSIENINSTNFLFSLDQLCFLP